MSDTTLDELGGIESNVVDLPRGIANGETISAMKATEGGVP